MYRHRLSALGRNIYTSLNISAYKIQVQSLQIFPTRNITYYDSKLEEAPEKYTQVEKSYDEWKYVEDLLPRTYVPEAPKDPTVEYPSGWKPPQETNLSYHVPRTKNFMVPVYYKSFNRGMMQFTRIRNVEGNIWVLEKEIGRYLKNKYPQKTIMTHVNEQCRYVNIRGDYEEEVKKWVLDKGF